MQTVNILVFDDFTILDALGPAEVLSRLNEDFRVDYVSVVGGKVRGSAGLELSTKPLSAIVEWDVLLVPGGYGTRKLVHDEEFLLHLKKLCEKSTFVLGVCTGSALLAKAGLLD